MSVPQTSQISSVFIRTFFLAAFVCLSPLAASAAAPSEKTASVSPSDWPAWRGPAGTGHAPADARPPLKWSETENVVWKTPVPGRGHSSPTVVGDRVYLTTADEEAETQSVLCFDRATGKPVWNVDVHRGKMDRKGNKKTSQACASVTCDGLRLYVNFLNNDAIHTTCLDLTGQQLWQTKVSDFKTHQGFGSSPTLHKGLLYITTDSPAGGAVAAVQADSGKIAWSQPRPKKANYASAVVLKIAGRDQVLVQGCDLVSSFDPLTGNKLWEVEGATTECVTQIVSDGERIFVTGGYPRNHVQAVLADGSGKTEWENTTRVYVPSMVVRDGRLYAILDAGVAMCWDSKTGVELWKERIGGTFSSSLVLAGDALFATSEAGQTTIFRATDGKYEQLGQNQLGNECFATPTFCGRRMYHRVVSTTGGKRQEWLYCVGE